VEHLLEKRYRHTGKPMRRCHARDLLSHALNLIHFEKLPYQLSEEILDRAFESCFLEEEESAPPVEDAATAKAEGRTCAAYWGARVAQVPTIFGGLHLLAALRSNPGARYEDAASVAEFGAEETSHALSRLHGQVFQRWINLHLSEQMQDLRKFMTSGGGANISRAWRELAPRLTPPGASESETSLFLNDFTTLMNSLAAESEQAA
jgi:hypothetical protein